MKNWFFGLIVVGATVAMMIQRSEVPDLVLIIVVFTAGPALGGVAQHGVTAHVGIPGETSSPRPHQSPLVCGLDGDNEVAGVGHHHVGHLVQALTGHLDTVHLENLVVDSQ